MTITDRSQSLRTEAEVAELDRSIAEQRSAKVERILSEMEAMIEDRENPVAILTFVQASVDEVERLGTPEQIERFDALESTI